MDILVLLIAVNLLPLAAVGSVAVPRIRFIIPWLGLATVVMGSFFAFASSANLVVNGLDGVGIGWLVTTFYGLVGLGIVLSYGRLRAIPFVPLGAIVAGIIHIASFYAYLPPYSFDSPSMLVFSAPGVALIAYGTILWLRNGLTGSMGDRSLGLRVALALVCVIGLGSMGFLGYQTKQTVTNQWFVHPPDLPHLASNSELVVEGVVTQKEPHSYKSQLPSGTTVSVVNTLYQIKVSQYWRGTGQETISVAVPDYSPVELKESKAYLLFLTGMIDEDALPGYWDLSVPEETWTTEVDGFHPYPGFSPSTPVSREEMAEILAQNPHS